MRTSLSVCFASIASSVLAAPSSLRARQDTPTVDLGYELHSSTYNSTGDYYIFKNVPYAEQPIGDFRFQKSVLPTGASSSVNDGGSADLECMQAYPGWVVELQAAAYGVDVATMAYILYNAGNQTESCLLLDIYVPASIYDLGIAAEAPVLVWTHGGGFTYGSKTSDFAGLLSRSNNTSIIVSLNYRLGVFGWLDGSDVTPNLGLYDQRLAFDWIKEYIGRFGGSASRITAMGESAGASSMLHHITASGGAEKAPFEQAVILSPAYQFNLDGANGYKLTMEEATSQTGGTVDSVEELKNLTSEQLKSINQAVVYASAIGGFNYGPVVDDTYVPNHPQVLLLEGKFDHSVNLLVSHTSNESVPFTPSNISTAEDVHAHISQLFPEASPETIEYMLTEIWPDVLDGTYPWTTEFARAVKIGTEVHFSCSSRYLSVAFDNHTYDSIFSYMPGYHAQDVPFYFFNGDTSTPNNGQLTNPTIAYAMQDHVMTFTLTGNPNYLGASVEWPIYGSDAQVLDYTFTGPDVGTDDLKNPRCDWIQQAMADGIL
ncbi:uncharacterized protein JN550_000197 [Neoarthrinium moseri]|uniref:uncharacterized protein n=1 Tax=Neoarthrinium moseri TaxID=1658444 RepID=UPI001FDB8B00|nr:uncharacterized protein JN550_000197 [Neoarthrinium moseri]KAI1878015.1 hypothetical protein JN550_000197 [Neoarthrinium moseri]